MTANPELDSPLRVDVEVRRVQEALRRSAFSDNIRIDYRPAADLRTLIDGLNDHRPQIVHFAGHSNISGLITDNADVAHPAGMPLSYEVLAKALSASDSPPRVVILNSCESAWAKPALSVVDVAITMRVPVSDIAATVFATHF